MQFATGLLVLTLTLTVACGTPTTPPLDNIVEHYKYGILGTEGRVGVPYWIFRVLPIVFADKLPNRPGNGWEKIGFLFETPDRDHPIGTTKANGQFGVDLVGLNCATCHAGTYREPSPASSTASRIESWSCAVLVTASSNARRRHRGSMRGLRRAPGVWTRSIPTRRCSGST